MEISYDDGKSLLKIRQEHERAGTRIGHLHRIRGELYLL